MRVGECSFESVPVCCAVVKSRAGRERDRVGGNSEDEGYVIRAAGITRGEVMVKEKRLSVREDEVWSPCPAVREASREVGSKKTESFQVCEMEE